jgi:hypothetical protein
MSKQYPGGIISKTAPVPSGPYASSTAPGVWTLEQQAYWQKLGQWPTQGVVNPDVFIENLFSTYLYAGSDGTQTITNGINLSINGGLVWVKGRNETFYHRLASSPGPTLPNYVASNATDAASSGNGTISAFTTTGFTVSAGGGGTNTSGYNYASWTFRKKAKFFDVVTYTGNQVAGRTVAHNLGSVPGFIACKRIDTPDEWFCYHRSLGPSQQILLNSTAASGTNNNQWNNTAPTDSVFSLGTDSGANGTGGTYVAYLFAHNAGGFGLSGTENVISCGSMAGAIGTTVTLGYEPQFVMYKASSTAGNWVIADNMRGFTANGGVAPLRPNLTDAEGTSVNIIKPTSTGFSVVGNLTSGQTYIYIAIRRGPMQVPTSGTSVFVPYAYTGNGSASRNYSAIGIVTDMNWTSCRSNDVGVSPLSSTRLLGNTARIQISSSGAEATGTYGLTWNAYQNGVQGNTVFSGGDGWNTSGYTYVGWNFKRSPNFFDVVCYTGNGTSGATQTHNLGVAPELMIVRQRTGGDWYVYASGTGATKFLVLNATDAAVIDSSTWNNTAPTNSVFTLGDATGVNRSATEFVAYLFATCAGVSKVGTYTGTGATQTISCGFTGGARFVLIKRTDTASYNWVVWDTARGMVSGTDPRLLLNNTGSESNADWVYTTTGGFEIVTSNASVNASGGSYIFLAIA